jgi:hypothetical protein
VDSSHINPEQAARMRDSVARSLRYLGKVRRRMEVLGFPPGDSLYQSVSRSHDVLQELHVRCHYCACTTGVAKAPVAAHPEPLAARDPSIYASPL